jgi:hypothetical protein
MEVRELPLDELVLDPNLNLRDRLDEETIARYTETWERLPPVTVFEIEGRWLLADGFHRHAAAVRRKRATVPAEVRAGTVADALDFAATANLAHGLPLSRAERRRAVEIKLRLHHDWSDRRLADDLAVGRDLIAKVRRQLVEAGQLPQESGRVGADGKTYSIGLPRDPNEYRPRGKSAARDETPRDRLDRASDGPPWDDPTDSLPNPGASSARAGSIVSPWDHDDAKAQALATPPTPASPTIDEMLALMTRQIREVLGWTLAGGFADAFRAASPRARQPFEAAVHELAQRVRQLQQG